MGGDFGDAATGLEFPATAQGLRAASEWLERECQSRGVPAEQVMRLDLCLNEVVANAMAHGGEAAGRAPVALGLETGSDDAARCARLCIVDAGNPFNPLTQDIPPPSATLGEAAIGGLGLLMLGHCADGLDYEYRGGRNRLLVTVRWGGAVS